MAHTDQRPANWLPARAPRLMDLLIAIAIALFFVIAEAASGQTIAQVGTQPRARTDVPGALNIAPRTGEIRIDGRVDEAAWQSARRVTDFREFQPNRMTEPGVRTEAYVTFDDEYLYVAVVSHDDPALVRASLRERDDMFADDWAGLVLDTHGDQSWGYLIIANAYGVQGDTRLSNNGDDERFDVIFAANGSITDTGWEVEIAVPFSSLRFNGDDTGNWRIGFIRNHPRDSRRMYAWPAIDSDNPCLLCQFQPINALEGVRPQGSLELLPSVVASQAGSLRDFDDPDAGFANDDPSASFSLGARYPFGAGWSAEATYNPDFSQVESDAAQVDVNTTFALSFPERRPFFQEGAELFDTPIDVVYTRSINDPQFAGKLTGTLGSTGIALLSAYDENTPIIVPFAERSAFAQGGRSWSNVLRARHGFGGGSHFGALLTDRRLVDGGAGTTVSADALFRFADVYSTGFQIVASHTQEPDDATMTENVNGDVFGDGHTADFDGERFWGAAFATGISRSTRTWSWDAGYNQSSPTFRADNGFVARNAYRQLSGWTNYTFRPERFGIVELRPGLSGGQVWAWDGGTKDRYVNPSVNLLLTGQTNAGLWTVFTNLERFGGIDFENYARGGFWVNSNFSERVGGGFEASYGEQIYRPGEPPVIGTGGFYSVWATLKPLDRLVIQPSVSYQNLDGPDDDELYAGWVARTRVMLQFNRELSLRLVTQYVDFGSGGLSVEPLVMYRLNPFSIFYVGMTDRFSDYGGETGFAETNRQFFLKFQYLLRT